MGFEREMWVCVGVCGGSMTTSVHSSLPHTANSETKEQFQHIKRDKGAQCVVCEEPHQNRWSAQHCPADVMWQGQALCKRAARWHWSSIYIYIYIYIYIHSKTSPNRWTTGSTLCGRFREVVGLRSSNTSMGDRLGSK